MAPTKRTLYRNPALPGEFRIRKVRKGADGRGKVVYVKPPRNARRMMGGGEVKTYQSYASARDEECKHNKGVVTVRLPKPIPNSMIGHMVNYLTSEYEDRKINCPIH